jgi:hypothetical protein
MSPRRTAQVAILGAQIRTLDPTLPSATAVAIHDGEILAVGTDDEVREACDGQTEVVDGSGLAIVPGLTDSHIHPMWATDFAAGVDASQFAVRTALADALRAERERVGRDGIVRAWSLDYAMFAGEDMHGAVLEEMAGGPALGVFFDLHTYLATPSVLAMADVSGAEPFPDASEIVVDADGRATGELREFSAFFRVADRLPGATPEARLRRVAAVLRELNAAGLTGAHVMDGSPATYELLRTLEERGDLTLRMVVPLWVKPEHDDATYEEYVALRDAAGTLWRGGAAKFFADGVIDSGTAWLEEPDTRGDGNLPFWPDPARYDAAVARFGGAGFQCITHAVGDRAVRAALDAYRAAGPPARGMHRIEHIETLAPEVRRRLAAEGVAASMQPLHMQWRQADGRDEWARRLGRRRTALAFPTGDMLRDGATVALGSDWPVAPSDPRYGMAWARLRRHPGRAEAAFEPDQCLTAEQALEGYTTGAAAVVGESDLSGRIAPGMRADLTAFAADPVDTPADELPSLPVAMTVVGGRVVHRLT